LIPQSSQLSNAFSKSNINENNWVKDKYMLLAKRDKTPVYFNGRITKEELKSGKV